MESVQMPEINRLTQPNNQGNIQRQSQRNQDQIPNQNALRSRGQTSPSLTPMQKITPMLMSELYGFCLGNSIASIRDHGGDAWSIGAGIVLSSIAGIHVWTEYKRCTSKAQLAINGCLFALCAASAVVTTSHSYCKG